MKIAGRGLIGLGAFLLVLGLLAATWATGAVKKTPTDVNRTTYLSGTASKLGGPTKPVYAISRDAVDSGKSDSSTDLWTSSSCVMFGTDSSVGCLAADDPQTLALPPPEVFATSRTTALGVASDQLPAGAIDGVGTLFNKFPFDAEQRTYPYWDNTLGRPVDAVYTGSQDIQGVHVNEYVVDTQKAPVTIAKGVSGFYTDRKEIYVEPKTGAIINQTEHVVQTLDDGTEAVDLTLAFTPDQVDSFVSEAKSNVPKLALITTVVPIVGIAGGAVCLVLGAFLLFRNNRRRGRRVADVDDPQLANV